MLKFIYAVSAIGLVAGTSAPGLAQAQSNAPAASQQQASSQNPNEMICRKQEVTGSRLGAKKVCKTRAEWADAQLQDKQELTRVQTQRGNAGNGP